MKLPNTFCARSKTLVGVAATAGLLGFFTNSAVAQSEASAEDTSVWLEEIIVTAQKREQSIFDVGITMSVLDQQALEDQRVQTPTDAVILTPSATVKETIPGLMPIVTIRGIGLNDFNATNNPATGVYLDEISLGSLALLSSDLFDLERVEILKGPQGTLYGRNSTAGAMNIVSAAPSLNENSGKISVGIGNYSSSDVEGMANIAVSDTFALRLSGKGVLQDQGFYFDETRDRDVGRREVAMARAQALWAPNDVWNVRLKLEGQRGRSELGQPEFFGGLPTATEQNCPGLPTCSDFFGYADTDGDPFRGAWSVDPTYDRDQFSAGAYVTAEFEGLTFTSITGYIDFDREYSADVDAGPLPQLDFRNSDEISQFSQEFRVSGSNRLVDWQFGVFYAKDDVLTVYEGDLAALFNTTTTSRADQETTSQALFANAEWRLNDTLSLITGLRFTNEKREHVGFTQDNVSEIPGSGLTMAPLGTPPIILASVDDEIDDTNTSWKLGLNLKPWSNSLFYVSATEGTKSGGFFAGFASTDAQLQPYDPESLTAYEAGIKGALSEIGLTYEASLFYYDYADVQTFIRDTVGAVPIQRLSNVDDANVKGAELVLAYRPSGINGLELNAGASVLDTELGAFEASAGLVAAGNSLPDAPDSSFLLGGEQVFTLSDALSMRVRIDARYQSDVFRDALNDPFLESEGYWLLSGRVSLLSDNDWDFSIWGKNLSDERYVSQATNQLVFALGSRGYGAPRTYGVSISKQF